MGLINQNTRVLNTADAAAYIGKSENTLRRWRTAGLDAEGHAVLGPDFVRVGLNTGRVHYEQGELDRYLREGEHSRRTGRSVQAQPLPHVPDLVLPSVPHLRE